MERAMDKGVMEAAGVSVRPTFAISTGHTGPKRISADHPMGRAFTANREPELAKHDDEELERRMYVRTSELGTHDEEGLQRSISERSSAGVTCTRFERAANEAFQTSSSLGYAGSNCSDNGAGCALPTLEDGWAASVSLLEKYKQAAELHPRSREGLDAEWKAARRGDRWRHQWLSVRLTQLQLESSKYDRILASMKPETYSDTREKAESDLSASGTTLVQKSVKHRPKSAPMRMEVGSDLEDHSEVDPVVSQCTDGDKDHENKVENMGGVVESKDLRHNSSEHRFPIEQGPVGGEESFEDLLWKVECLQNRVETLRYLLVMGAPVTKDGAESSAMTAPAIGGSLTAPPSPATTHAARPASTRRRASDYDIDNMVMPVKVGSKFVEMVKPAHIETPQWRVVDETSVIEDESSSLEATDDETYAKRHALMEFRERQQRCLPRCNKKGSHVDAARFGPVVGKVVAEGKTEDPKVQVTSASWSSRPVPRKKRSRALRGERG